MNKYRFITKDYFFGITLSMKQHQTTNMLIVFLQTEVENKVNK